jgi:hypothetical protein
MLRAARNSAFSHAIGVVLLRSPNKKVLRVNAQGHIATVTNAESRRNLSEMDLPTQAVRPNKSLTNRSLSVSPVRFAADPQPAFLWRAFRNVTPKVGLDLGRDLRQKAASRFRSHTAVWVRALGLLKQSLRPLFYSVQP